MTTLDVEPQIRGIIADAFEMKPADLGDSPSKQTIGEWDSFAQLSLVLAVEEVFGIKFSDEQVFAADSAAKIAAFVEEALRKN